VFTDTAARLLPFSTTGTRLGGGSVSVDSTTVAYIYLPSEAQRPDATPYGVFPLNESNWTGYREPATGAGPAGREH
jgi:hypothetical protein